MINNILGEIVVKSAYEVCLFFGATTYEMKDDSRVAGDPPMAAVLDIYIYIYIYIYVYTH